MELEKENVFKVLKREPLSQYTTWRVGGFAKTLFKPHSIDELCRFLKTLPESEPLLWLGLGSNALIRDGGFNGAVILTQGGLMGLELLEDNVVRVEAGVSCAQMARFCARNNLGHAEFWAGIPGTMGGALRMNAGCFNGETWDHVIELETIDKQGIVYHKNPSDFKVSYRSVDKLNGQWFVAAKFKLPQGNKAKSMETIKSLLARRAKTQPTGELNCGSVFRNPEKDYAARLIEASGLKGKSIGHAMVSNKHANFIINDKGCASAKDIEHLINHVHTTVLNETGVNLKQEVHILGDHYES